MIEGTSSQEVRRLYALVEVDGPIICAPDALGHSIPVSLGGVQGRLELPALPDWSTNNSDPLNSPLLGPGDAKLWRQGDRLIDWGRPRSFPSGVSEAKKLLLYFDVAESAVDAEADKIHRAYDNWRALLISYLELVTKQRRRPELRVVGPESLDLFFWSAKAKKGVPANAVHVSLEINALDENAALTRTQLLQICDLASRSIEVKLEHRLQLAAYRAYSSGDYRKAVIETAAAAEMSLTSAILRNFEAAGINYGNGLLKKFRTLGGRLELARLVQLPIPDLNLKSLLVEPRNQVVHQAHFVDERQSLKAVVATDEILGLLSPIPQPSSTSDTGRACFGSS